MAERVRENRLRRVADRQGLRLVKSRRRDPRAVDYGRYMLVDLATGAVVVGAGALGRPVWDLDQVEAHLTRAPGGGAAKQIDVALQDGASRPHLVAGSGT
jgi:hypothetical protein